MAQAAMFPGMVLGAGLHASVLKASQRFGQLVSSGLGAAGLSSSPLS